MIGDLCCLARKWKTTHFYIWLNKVCEVVMLYRQKWLVISFLDDPLKLAEYNEFIHHLWLSVLSPECTQDNSILEWRVLKSSDKSNITGKVISQWSLRGHCYVHLDQFPTGWDPKLQKRSGQEAIFFKWHQYFSVTRLPRLFKKKNGEIKKLSWFWFCWHIFVFHSL